MHGNTDNRHCHVAVSRIHPITFKSRNIEWAHKTLHYAARQSEIKHGWTVDNGPEFFSKVLDEWAYRRWLQLRFIEPGKPQQNAYIESFNGKFRDECLNEHWF